MRKVGLVLAAVAAISMTVLPVAPALAQSGSNGAMTPAQRQLLALAQQGAMAVLTPAQMNTLAATDRKLHEKLETARANRVAPNLTPIERQKIQRLTMANVRNIKAGQTSVTVNKPPAAAEAPTNDVSKAFTSCFAAIGSAAAFGIIGGIIAGVACVLLFIPLIPWKMIGDFFAAVTASAARP